MSMNNIDYYPSTEEGQSELTAVVIRDCEGAEVKAGHTIHFSYGIPPIGVDAKIVEEDGILIVLTPGHAPEKATLGEFNEYMDFYVVDDV